MLPSVNVASLAAQLQGVVVVVVVVVVIAVVVTGSTRSTQQKISTNKSTLLRFVVLCCCCCYWSFLLSLPTLPTTITNIVNLSLSSGQFHHILKESTISPLIKKSTLDKESTLKLPPSLQPVSHIHSHRTCCQILTY